MFTYGKKENCMSKGGDRKTHKSSLTKAWKCTGRKHFTVQSFDWLSLSFVSIPRIGLLNSVTWFTQNTRVLTGRTKRTASIKHKVFNHM